MAVGRCMSADTTVWDVTRAIPACALTGEAAGTASAMAIQSFDGDLACLPIADLQDRLAAQGGLLDRELIKAVPPDTE
ncbi:MAG: FAD-dependent oxidoreductase [Gemmatimonadetes bacterium]|nr:FAD-dependent oxidoreductase [Gemmatimonadota bacterium]MBT7862399.1 FAD-dependent oxidoreductase [Gemmatimonadota bacterium]